ncbi:MAG: lysophospholipase [Deltaproteobacteria bacterium]|nr:lysophospholipase [Deltaproteobacteria bacterium]
MTIKKPEKKESILIDSHYRKITFCSWIPQKPICQLVIIHGYSEHIRRYDIVSEEMASQGIAVHLMDLPGHGHSEGPRGHIDHFQEYLDSVDWFIQNNPNFLKKMPSFLFGHSMGGLISTHYCLQNKTVNGFKGLIISAPLFGFDPIEIIPLRIVSKILERYDNNRTYPKSMNPKILTRDPAKWDAYYQDPFRLHRISPNLFQFLLDYSHSVHRLSHELSIPLLVFKTEADRVVSPHAIQRFFNKAGSDDKKMVVFTKPMHEIINEKEKDTMIKLLINWIIERL